MFERSREPCATCLRSSGVENLALPVYVRAESRTFLTPCLCSSGVENTDTMFTFERSREPFLLGRRSREPCATCLRSSGVENFLLCKRSREPCPTFLLVYVRAKSRTFLTPCLCSSGVENPLSNSPSK
jgi:hypothetical protein